MADIRPRRRADIEAAELDGETVLFDRGRVHRLDVVGSEIWSRLDGRATVAELAVALGTDFGESPTDVHDDLARFVDQLAANGLLGPVPHGPPPPSATRVEEARRPHAPVPVDTPSFRALSWSFAVCAEGDLGRYLLELFAPFASSEPAEHRYEVVRNRDGPARQRLEVRRDGEPQIRTDKAWLAIAWLLWDTNQQAILAEREHVLVHAAAAALDDAAVLIPAPMGAGKSTLVAGLALGGFGYLTDEAAAIPLGGAVIEPYPRTLSVEGVSQALLPALRPPPSWRSRYTRRQWHIDARSLGAGTPSGPVEISAIVTLELRPGAPSELTPLARSEALVALCRNAWNLEGLGAMAFDTLRTVVARSRCFHLTFGDPETAIEGIRGVLRSPDYTG